MDSNSLDAQSASPLIKAFRRIREAAQDQSRFAVLSGYEELAAAVEKVISKPIRDQAVASLDPVAAVLGLALAWASDELAHAVAAHGVEKIRDGEGDGSGSDSNAPRIADQIDRLITRIVTLGKEIDTCHARARMARSWSS